MLDLKRKARQVNDWGSPEGRALLDLYQQVRATINNVYLEMLDIQRVFPDVDYDISKEVTYGEMAMKKYQIYIEATIHATVSMAEVPSGMSEEEVKAAAVEALHAALPQQATVGTSYGSGPYRIVEIQGNCRCPDYFDLINDEYGRVKDSPAHLHLVCVKAEEPPAPRYAHGKLYWLNGYRKINGVYRCVWRPRDHLIIHGYAAGGQMSIF